MINGDGPGIDDAAQIRKSSVPDPTAEFGNFSVSTFSLNMENPLVGFEYNLLCVLGDLAVRACIPFAKGLATCRFPDSDRIGE